MFNIAIHIIPIGLIADRFQIDRFCCDRFQTDTFYSYTFCLGAAKTVMDLRLQGTFYSKLCRSSSAKIILICLRFSSYKALFQLGLVST